MGNGTDLLRLFYEENDKWTFVFENYVLLSRLKSLNQVDKLIQKEHSTKDTNFFLERSILSSFNVFTLNSFQEKKLNQIEYDILTEFYNFYYETIFRNQEKKKMNELFKIIYIKTNPDICLDRILKRRRKSENQITLDYLTKINDKYEAWINRVLNERSFTVEVVNGNLSLEHVIFQIEKLVLH